MKKISILAAIIFCSAIVLFSCQKEIDYDLSSPGNAVISSNGTDCSPSVVYGTYIKGKDLNPDSNYIELTLNVQDPGKFEIKTDTINGYAFSGSEKIKKAGLSKIKLKGGGRPLQSTIGLGNVFNLRYGSSNCKVTIKVLPDSPRATFALLGNPGNCSGAVTQGIYFAGVPLNPSLNYIKASVFVANTGIWSVGPVLINGMVFEGSGVFTTTGNQTIDIPGQGQPSASGTFNVNLNANNPSGSGTLCTVPITVLPAPTNTATYTFSGAPNNCTNSVVSGNYAQGVPTNNTNKVSVEVNVTKIGTYYITTTTANGITFTATGNFSNTGTQVVDLLASGTPTNVGITSYTINNNGCKFSVTTQPPAAVFTYIGGTGNCTGALVSGNYTVGTAMGVTNFVTLSVNVTSLGTYNISTNLVNGIRFAAVGVFTNLGLQTVTLLATGVPLAAGTNSYQINNGCTFNVNTTASGGGGGIPTTGNYLPTSANSWWSYDSGLTPDTLVVRVQGGNQTVGGNTYIRHRLFEGTANTGEDRLYRVVGNDYFQYQNVDDYGTQTGGVDGFADIKILSDNLPPGSTWQSANIPVGTSGLLYRVNSTIVSTNGTKIVNGRTYNNVIYVRHIYQYKPATATNFQNDTQFDMYFSKDIGIIQVSASIFVAGVPLPVFDDFIRFYQIN